MKKIAHSGTFEQSQFTLEMTHCFMRTFRVLKALARSNAYKKKGYSVASVFLYLFEQAFCNRGAFSGRSAISRMGQK